MGETLHLEPVLAAGYALLLVAIAAGLEWMGQHSHRRANRYVIGGFRFRTDTAHWECPMGARLHMSEVNHELRVTHYRAPARTCNGCSMKPECTDSDHGRVISVPMDPWLTSAIGRFHRGISLSILVLAGLIISIEIFRHDHGMELPALGGLMVMVSLLVLNLLRGLRGDTTDRGRSFMRTSLKALFIFSILLSPTWLCATESDGSAASAFKQLGSLVGKWEGKFEDGRPHSVSYMLTAGGSVLVETWTLGPGRESVTLYHMDGENLVAEHYCLQGNQPRLQLTKGGDADKLSFVFRDGTNLKVKGKSHQHAFWIKLSGQDSFVRSETYVENGSSSNEVANASPGGPITYHRMTSAGQQH